MLLNQSRDAVILNLTMHRLIETLINTCNCCILIGELTIPQLHAQLLNVRLREISKQQIRVHTQTCISIYLIFTRVTSIATLATDAAQNPCSFARAAFRTLTSAFASTRYVIYISFLIRGLI